VKFLVLIYPHGIGVTVEYTSHNYSEVFMLWNDTDTGVRGMMFNVTFHNILAISWRSVLLVDETRSTHRKPQTCRKSLTNFIT
jgi:hypothetical protein